MKKIFFGKNLKYLRKKLNLNQAEIYDRIGFKRATWSGYETESSFPNFKDLLKISDFFGINEGDLINIDLENVHLIKKEGEEKKIENVHLNVHPSVHLTDKIEGKKVTIYGEETPFNYSLNEDQVPYKTAQEQMHDLASKVAKLEAFISKLSKENEARGKPRPKRPAKK